MAKIKIDVTVKHETYNGKDWIVLESLDNPDLVSQGKTFRKAYKELVGNYKALQRGRFEYPYCHANSFVEWHKFFPVMAKCPKCSGEDLEDYQWIDPKTGVCENCGFDIKELSANEAAKLLGCQYKGFGIHKIMTNKEK